MLLRLEGRLDVTNTKEFESIIQPLMTGDKPDIEIDCTEFTYISSFGLRIFLMLQKSVISRHGRLVLKSLAPQIRQVFDMTGFTSVFTIEE